MEPSTVLFLAANPVRLQWLQLGEECRAIEDKIRAAKFRDRLRFRSRWAARPGDLLQALNEDTPTVLHFSGHGDGDQGLCFQAEDGSARSVSADGLAKVMQAAGSSVVVVLLNACYSEAQAQTLSAHIPCVIGMSGALGDEEAVVYAASFYGALAFGKSVANAHEQGVAALALTSNRGASRDVAPLTAAQCASGPRLLTRPDIDANSIYVVQRRTDKIRCTVIIKATLREFNADVLARVTEELRQWTGDLSLQITDIEEGSVRLTIALSVEAAKALAEAKASGQLTHLGGFRVTDVVATGEVELEARSAPGTVATTNQDHVGFHEQHFAGELQVGWRQPVASFTDRYRVVRLIDIGGRGSVYEADDIERRQKVALKTVPQLDTEKIYQLQREFRSVAKLSHPNLAVLYDLVVADSCFLTMELLDGVDLLTYLWDRKVENPSRPTPTTLTRIPVAFEGTDREDNTVNSPRSTPCDIDRLRHALPQLTRGLHALHSASKIHGDVKPSNIRVTSDGRVVLLNFGVVAELERSQGADGQIVGTVAYMAPEQCAGDIQLTAAADWYGLGVVLFQALTGRRPFEGMPTRVLFEKQTVAAPRPSTLVQQIPRDLDDLCIQLLERDPTDRPTGPQLMHRLQVAEPRVPEQREALRIGTIQLGEEGITEFTREGHRSAFVRRSEIERVALARGFTSERPIAALVGAVVCLGITAAALVMMIAAALGPSGVVSLKLAIAVVFPALIGALCLWTLVHRGLYLRVSTARDTRKLRLLGAIDSAALRDALTAARARFGYDVDLTHLDEVASHRRRA